MNAQYWYGRMLVEGRGVEADPEEGRAWIARAAEAGMVDAAGGARGDDGEWPRRPAGPSRRRWRCSRRRPSKGHVGAMFAIGAMNGGGHDVPTDRAAAQRWFRAAAERGHAHAQMMLGRYLARGLAGEHATRWRRGIWLERAVAQGLAEASADLAGLPPPPATRGLNSTPSDAN